jgi:hypothetical protein
MRSHPLVPAGPGCDPVAIDTRVAHAARIYDYLLGGVDNFAVDREAVERASAALPGGLERARLMVRSQRLFLASVVRCLAGELGVRQFLDIGTGIPNADNVHAVAQDTAPAARVVYVDNDPVVLAHAHTLMRPTRKGTGAYVHGDLRAPARILRQAATTLNFARPVAVILVGVLHLIRDEDDPYRIVARLLEAVPSGSYLVLSHLASDVEPELVDAIARANETMSDPFVLRTRGQVARLLDGLDVVEPGIVTLDRWPWAKGTACPPERPVAAYCAVGRKP